MSDNMRAGIGVVGTLRAVDGSGVVRMEDRYDTDIDDLWSAPSASAASSTPASPAVGKALAASTCANPRVTFA